MPLVHQDFFWSHLHRIAFLSTFFSFFRIGHCMQTPSKDFLPIVRFFSPQKSFLVRKKYPFDSGEFARLK